jgi:hypothetical protein
MARAEASSEVEIAGDGFGRRRAQVVAARGIRVPAGMLCILMLALVGLGACGGDERERGAALEGLAVHQTQTCSRPSTCETDAARRARAAAALRRRAEELDRLYRPTPVAAPGPAGEGFDWGDAGVGAGAGFGLALVGGACVLAVRSRGRVRVAHR